jgi:hypothetical protein
MSLARQGVKPFFGQFRATSQAYYIDDSWKVRPNLTITLGLRYEFTPPYYDKSQNFANVLIPFWDDGAGPITDQSLHPTLVRIGSGNFYQGLSIQYPSNVQVARNGSLGPDGIFPDYKDWAPRPAWELHGARGDGRSARARASFIHKTLPLPPLTLRAILRERRSYKRMRAPSI